MRMKFYRFELIFVPEMTGICYCVFFINLLFKYGFDQIPN